MIIVMFSLGFGSMGMAVRGEFKLDFGNGFFVYGVMIRLVFSEKSGMVGEMGSSDILD